MAWGVGTGLASFIGSGFAARAVHDGIGKRQFGLHPGGCCSVALWGFIERKGLVDDESAEGSRSPQRFDALRIRMYNRIRRVVLASALIAGFDFGLSFLVGY